MTPEDNAMDGLAGKSVTTRKGQKTTEDTDV